MDSYNKELGKNKNKIINENKKDLRNCKRQNLIDRLILDKNKIENIRNSLNEIKKFKNPLGKIITRWKRPNGLTIKKISIPILSMPKEVFLHTKKSCKKNSKIGILSTEATLKTGVYSRYFKKNYKLVSPTNHFKKILLIKH